MVTFSLPNTFRSVSSARISRPSAGVCSLFALMHSQTLLTTSPLANFPPPTTAASSSEGCSGCCKAFGLPGFGFSTVVPFGVFPGAFVIGVLSNGTANLNGRGSNLLQQAEVLPQLFSSAQSALVLPLLGPIPHCRDYGGLGQVGSGRCPRPVGRHDVVRPDGDHHTDAGHCRVPHHDGPARKSPGPALAASGRGPGAAAPGPGASGRRHRGSAPRLGPPALQRQSAAKIFCTFLLLHRLCNLTRQIRRRC